MTWSSVTQICCNPKSTVSTLGKLPCSLALGHPEIPSGVLMPSVQPRQTLDFPRQRWQQES